MSDNTLTAIANEVKKIDHKLDRLLTTMTDKQSKPKTAKQKRAHDRKQLLSGMSKEEKESYLQDEYDKMTDVQKTKVDKRRVKNAEFRRKKAARNAEKTKEAVDKAEDDLEAAQDNTEGSLQQESPYTNPYLPRF